MVARTLVSMFLCLLCFLAGRRYEREDVREWHYGRMSLEHQAWRSELNSCRAETGRCEIRLSNETNLRRRWELEASARSVGGRGWKCFAGGGGFAVVHDVENIARLERCQWELKQARGGMPKPRDHKYGEVR